MKPKILDNENKMMPFLTSKQNIDEEKLERIFRQMQIWK